MGDVSVIARRLKDGHVQHGWSGNGGYFSVVGSRLLKWYTTPEKVEYLFSLGQLRFLGAPNSEKGGFRFVETHSLTRSPHYLGNSENDMFSKIAFIDYGYLYDVDNKWYYVVPHMFRIKIPLELIQRNLDDNGFEFEFLKKVEKQILEYILKKYVNEDTEFRSLLEEKGCDNNFIYSQYADREYALYEFIETYKSIYEYFDNWIVVRVDDNHEVTGFKMKKKTKKHIETSKWSSANS